MTDPLISAHSIEFDAALQSLDPRELLVIGSTGWLRQFLMLAVHRYVATAPVRGVPWHRLGPARPVGHNEMVAPFVWWPQLGHATFESFHGELLVRVADRRVTFGISGTATGGQPDQTNAILAELLRLIVAAVGALEPPAG